MADWFLLYRILASKRKCLLTSGLVVIVFVIVYLRSTYTILSNTALIPLPVKPIATIVENEMPVKIHKYVNIFSESEESEEDRKSIDTNQCVPLKTAIGPTPICVYDPKIDVYVSSSIIKHGNWEQDYTDLMTSILKENSDMQLLDLGSNIGVFTIHAAKMGHRVVAVDANKLNLRLLSKSLSLGGLRNYVTLVWNAVTNVHETIELTITTGNIGGSFVKSAGELNLYPKANFTETQEVRAITLEDLKVFFTGIPLFIKMDIQGSERDALKGGEIFLQDVNVRYILMEWVLYKKTEDGPEFAKYMTNFGLQPHEPNMEMKRLNIDNVNSWPPDVLWIKE